MSIIQDPRIYNGEHCETAASGVLFNHADIDLSEPMMLGLGQGFGFIYWKMNFMNLPFIGGRAKPFDLTRVLCSNLNIPLDYRETTSRKKAWANLTGPIDEGAPVALQVDCYHLEHFGHAFHFAGHFITAYGYDENYVYVFDTGKKYRVSIDNLEKSRFEKGPMAGKALSYTISKAYNMTPIAEIIPGTLHEIAKEFLNPPLKCFGYLGIQKLAGEIPKWLKCVPDPRADLLAQADMMENAGTGGAIFRNFFRDYLYEALEYYPRNAKLTEGADLYRQAASLWSDIAGLIKKVGLSGEQKYLQQASEKCIQASEVEKKAMESLVSIL